MRKLLYTVLLISMWLCAGAQEVIDQLEQERENTHRVGFNATGILERLANGNDDAAFSSPYLFTYDLLWDKMNLRIGIGPEYSDETIVHEGFLDSQSKLHFLLNGRIGVGFKVIEDRRWTVRAGVDAIGSYMKDEDAEDTGFDEVTDRIERYEIGGGPFVELAFMISERISLSTSSSLIGSYFTERHTLLFKNFPDFNDELNKTTGQKLNIILPTSVYVHFHF